VQTVTIPLQLLLRHSTCSNTSKDDSSCSLLVGT